MINNTGHLINKLHGLLYMVWTPKIVLEQKNLEPWISGVWQNMDNLNMLLFPITSPSPKKEKEIFFILDLAKHENYLKSELGSLNSHPTHTPSFPTP